MDHQPVGAASNRADDLRSRLVRVAYALHLSAADAAAQSEQRAQRATQPTAVDYRVEAKRWRAASEQALDIVRAWERPRALTGAEPTSDADMPGTSAPPDVATVADDVVHHLFRAALRLRTLPSSANTPGPAPVEDALHEIDDAIRDIRALVFARIRRVATEPGSNDTPEDR